MTHQNSAVERQIRPQELQDQLGIKKDAYYAYLKHLEITAEKDSNGKAYLTEDQAERIRQLRAHVVAGGKIESFDPSQGTALTVAESGELEAQPEAVEVDPAQGLDMEALYLEASELAAQRLTVGQQVVMAMASQMSYDDLHPTARAKVDQVRQAAHPKFNAQEVASSLLQRCRQQVAA